MDKHRPLPRHSQGKDRSVQDDPGDAGLKGAVGTRRAPEAARPARAHLPEGLGGDEWEFPEVGLSGHRLGVSTCPGSDS